MLGLARTSKKDAYLERQKEYRRKQRQQAIERQKDLIASGQFDYTREAVIKEVDMKYYQYR